jgi:hypothetical protein
MSKRSEWEPTPESHEYLARMRLIVGWDKALYRAHKHDTTELSAYLRRPDLPLDEDKREELAALIDRLIDRRKEVKGRKPGRIPPSNPDAITVHHVVASTRDELDRIRQSNGGKLPRGSYRAALWQVCQRLGDEGENVEINEKQALKMLKRGRR